MPVVAGISGSLESVPGLLKLFQIRAQATLASGIGSLESIPGLLKRLQIQAQATLASGIGSLKLINFRKFYTVRQKTPNLKNWHCKPSLKLRKISNFFLEGGAIFVTHTVQF